MYLRSPLSIPSIQRTSSTRRSIVVSTISLQADPTDLALFSEFGGAKITESVCFAILKNIFFLILRPQVHHAHFLQRGTNVQVLEYHVKDNSTFLSTKVVLLGFGLLIKGHRTARLAIHDTGGNGLKPARYLNISLN